MMQHVENTSQLCNFRTTQNSVLVEDVVVQLTLDEVSLHVFVQSKTQMVMRPISVK